MNRVTRQGRTVLFAAALATTPAAYATNGYFQIGYGTDSVAMGGAAVANPQDALAAAANPAGMAHVGEGWGVGARVFSPRRDGSLDCRSNAAPVPPCTVNVSADSGREYFVIPDFGFVKKINERVYAGISVFGNGGMNTHYSRNIYDEALARSLAGVPGFPLAGLPAGSTATGTAGTGTLGVNLSQLLITPTLTYNINENHTLGVSLVGGVQMFSARGLGNFVALSNDPGSLTNRQTDTAVGLGVRVGWQGQVHPMVTLGASYASKVYMTKFEKYSGLFAEDGSFDTPANLTVGLAVKATPKLTLAFDAQRIFYGDVDSINNSGPTTAEFFAGFGGGCAGLPDPTRCLGASNGIGFGWDSIWAFKFGAKYKYNDKWTFRAGYNHGESPIPDSDILFNIVAPGVVEDHITAGISYQSSKQSRWSVSYMHALDRGQSTASTAFLGAGAQISMHQHAVNIGYSRSF